MSPNNHTPIVHWWKTSGVFALLIVIVVGIAFSLPRDQGISLIVVGVVAFAVALFFNPRYRFMRAAVSLTSAWLASRGLPTIIGMVSTSEGLLAFSFENNAGWSFDIACSALALGLFVLDYRTRNPNAPSRQITSAVVRTFSPLRQHGEHVSQQAQIGDIVGDNAQIKIQNIEAKQDFNPEIDSAASFLKQGKPDIVIEYLQRLRRQSWDRMSDREKFRVLANLGHAYAHKDQHDDAAKFFIEAKGYQEHDEQALALEAAAYLSMGDDETARRLAKNVLERFPTSEIATSVVIRTCTDDRPTAEVEQDVPQQLRNSLEVIGALFLYAFRRDEIIDAIALARRLVSLDENSTTSKEHLGSALVRKAALSRQQTIAASSAETRAELVEAIGLLTTVLESESMPSTETRSRARYYRAIAYDFTDRPDLAEADFRTAVEPAHADKGILFQFGLLLLRQDKTSEALKLFERASTPDGDVGPDLIRAKILAQSTNAADHELAITLLEALQERLDDENERSRFEVVDALMDVYLRARNREVADTYLSSVKDKLADASFLTIAASTAQRRGDSTGATELATRAVESVQHDTPVVVSFFLGNLLAELKENDLALKVLKPITTAQSMEGQVNLALACAHEAEDFRFIIQLCEDLRDEGNATPFAIEREVDTLERLSDFGTALQVIDDYLKDPGDQQFAKILRVRKSMIGKRLDRDELVEYSLENLPDVSDVPVRVGCAVAVILSEGPNPFFGAEYAYELLRRHFDEPDPHRCFLHVLGIGEEGRIKLPTPDKVEPGCAVQYSETTGDEQWVIVEDSASPAISRSEISPDSYLGKELINKSVGDEFFLRRDVVQDRTAKVTAVMHKMAYRKWDVMNLWEERFHEEHFVRKYEFAKTPDGELDVPAFLKSLERLHEGQKQIDKLVQAHPLSASGHARMSNLSILESVLHLSHDEELPVRCCRGTDEEYAVGSETASAMSGVVIEGAALATLYWTGVFTRLTGLPCKALVTEGTIDIFRQLLLDRHSRMWSKRFVTMGRRGVMFDETSDDAIKAAKKHLEDFISWIENYCEVRSAISLADFPREKRHEFAEVFGDEAIEAVALATSERLPLWTDDFAVAEFSKDMIEGRRVWSELVFEKCAEADLLSRQEVSQFKVSLVDAGYHFTRISTEMADVALDAAHWDPTARPLSSMVTWLCTSGVKLIGALRLGSYMMKRTQEAAPLAHQKSAVTKRVVRSLADRNDGIEALNSLQPCLDAIFGLDALSKRECAAIMQQELVRKARERRLILPGDPDWSL